MDLSAYQPSGRTGGCKIGLHIISHAFDLGIKQEEIEHDLRTALPSLHFRSSLFCAKPQMVALPGHLLILRRQ